MIARKDYRNLFTRPSTSPISLGWLSLFLSSSQPERDGRDGCRVNDDLSFPAAASMTSSLSRVKRLQGKRSSHLLLLSVPSTRRLYPFLFFLIAWCMETEMKMGDDVVGVLSLPISFPLARSLGWPEGKRRPQERHVEDLFFLPFRSLPGQG